MECKFDYNNGNAISPGELIDTLWNVNYRSSISFLLIIYELIDTLWNVNEEKFMTYNISAFRINRYIMECKFNSLAVSNWYLCELIDTLWNVNKYVCNSSYFRRL